MTCVVGALLMDLPNNRCLQMSVLINQQDETINAIETQAGRVEDDTRGG